MNDQIMEEEMTYKRIKRGVLSLTGVIKEMKIKTKKYNEISSHTPSEWEKGRAVKSQDQTLARM